MKEKRIEKEIKKAQKKGIYNPKLKLGIIGLILTIGTIIGTSYAYYTETASNALIINATISKKIMVRVEAGEHGQVESMSIATKQADYGTAAKFTVTPSSGYKYKGVSCDNSANTSHSGTTLTVTPRTSKDVTCTVTFKAKPTLKEKILAAYTPKNNIPDFKTSLPSGYESNNEVVSNSGLYKAQDDDGLSYYFRGKIDNNYVRFGYGKIATSSEWIETSLLWRIVRINGDDSIRLILHGPIYADSNQFNNNDDLEKYVGYTYDTSSPCTKSNPCTSNFNGNNFTNNRGSNSTIKNTLETWYIKYLKSYDNYISYGRFCNDTTKNRMVESNIFYGENSTGYNPRLTCPDTSELYGGNYKLKIGLLTENEFIMAGGAYIDEKTKPNNRDNYLFQDANITTIGGFWLMSPGCFISSEAGVNTVDYLYDSLSAVSVSSTSAYYTDSKLLIKPVINLKPGIYFSSGTGSIDDPYVVRIN